MIENLQKLTPTIGLEIHAQLKTQSKALCGCENRYGAEPNTLTCPVCLGMPGALPMVNEKMVELGVITALALNSRITPRSRFDRKNYFYPDLPKGYQITQKELPLAQGGFLIIKVAGSDQRISLRQNPSGRRHRKILPYRSRLAGRFQPLRNPLIGNRHRTGHASPR